jgi:Heparinase II/III-like protein
VPTTAQHNTLLVDGAGQANEGNGHDPWAGFDYDLLNGQRITGVHATAASLDVTGEAATGYAPKLGPSRFERHLTFNGRTVTVHDTIEAAAPHTFTVLLHSDGAIRPAGSEFELGPNGHGLRATIVAPPNAHTEVQDNSVMAPGAPGSVDKGEVQDRGKRLAISTPAPARNATFELRLTIQPWY